MYELNLINDVMDKYVSFEKFTAIKLNWAKDMHQAVYMKEIVNFQLIYKHLKTTQASLNQQLRLFLDTQGNLAVVDAFTIPR